MPSFARIFHRSPTPSPAGDRQADPIVMPHREGLFATLGGRIQRAAAGARRSAGSLNGCGRFFASIGESFRSRGRRAEPAQQRAVPGGPSHGSMEPMVRIHVASQSPVIHVPSEFLNRDGIASLFRGGTGTELFRVLHEFAANRHCEDPFVFLQKLDEHEADMSVEQAADLLTEFVGTSAPRELNLSGPSIRDLRSKLAEATNAAERVAAFAGVRYEVEDSIYRSTYRDFQSEAKPRA